MNDKNTLKKQLLGYIEKETPRINEKIQDYANVIKYDLNENELVRNFPVGCNQTFSIVAKNDKFSLVKMNEIEKGRKNSLSRFERGFLISNILIFLSAIPIILYIVHYEVFTETQELLYLLCIFSYSCFALVASKSISKKKSRTFGVYSVEEMNIPSEDYGVFRSLSENHRKYNFESLYELFCESYVDFKTSGSPKAQETNIAIAKRIIEAIQVHIDVDVEQKMIERNTINNKWEVVQESLDYID